MLPMEPINIGVQKMGRLSKLLKTAALAGLFGFGVLAAMPASADRLMMRCDHDGDRCVRMICEKDGDDCRRATWRDDYYRENDRRRDRHDRDRDESRAENRDRGHWACDEDGDSCRWTYSDY